MHAPINTEVTASFMIIGMASTTGGLSDNRYDKIIKTWEHGCVELHTELCRYADLAMEIYRWAWAHKANEDITGVFDYEVSEPFGKWFGDYLLRIGTVPMAHRAMQKLCALNADLVQLDYKTHLQLIEEFVK